MKLERVLLWFMCLFLTQSISAQQFGIRGGLLVSNVNTKASDEVVTFEQLETEGGIGFFAGVAYVKQLNEYLDLKTEFLFVQKQSRQYRGADLFVYDYEYLSLPVLLRFNVWQGLGFEIGSKPSYWLSSNSLSNDIQKFDISLIGGISMMMNPHKIEFMFRFDHSLSPFESYNLVNANGDISGTLKSFHKSFQFGLGYYFN